MHKRFTNKSTAQCTYINDVHHLSRRHVANKIVYFVEHLESVNISFPTVALHKYIFFIKPLLDSFQTASTLEIVEIIFSCFGTEN